MWFLGGAGSAAAMGATIAFNVCELAQKSFETQKRLHAQMFI